jgi:Glycosyl transferase 4-like domain
VKKALLVSYYFPPRFTIGGKRAFRFARYLPEFGYSSVVLTARGPATEPLDPTFRDEELPFCEIRRDYLNDQEVAALKRLGYGSDGTIAEPTKIWGVRPVPFSRQWWLNETRFTPIVGPKIADVPKIARRIVDLVHKEKPDVLWATGSPWETVTAATLAARDLQIPFILDFRDPWSFGIGISSGSTFVRVVNSAIEKALLRRATMLTVTSEATRDKYISLDAAKRVECIRNGYDPAVLVEPRRSDRFTLVHFGNCYANRTLEPFLRAAARAVQDGLVNRDNFRILNLGRVAECDLNLTKELGLADQFEYRPVLPYEEGLGIVAGADLALLLAFGEEPWFIPGKLYDYVTARTPMLCVSSSSELDALVARTGIGWAYAANDFAGMAKRIGDAYEARKQGRRLGEPNQSVIESLSARNGAQRLAELFDEITKR